MSVTDTATFDAALRAAFEQYTAALPVETDVPPFPFSDLFETKMQRLIRRERRPWYVLVNTVGKRVAAILLAILVGLTATTLGVEALRKPVFDFFIELFGTHAVVSFPADGDTDPASTDSGPTTAFVFVPTEPTYIPEGYTVKKRDSYSDVHRVVYVGSNSESILYSQILVNNDTSINVEHYGYEVISVNGNDGVLYRAHTGTCILFSDGIYIYEVCVFSENSREEVFRIAESINIQNGKNP